MFATIPVGAPYYPDGAKPRKLPPQTPVRFPQCTPQSNGKAASSSDDSLVSLLQSIHRPADIRLSHLEALGLHVITDAQPQDLIPESNYLPPVEAWNAIQADDLLRANDATKRPLSNGNLSPGAQMYRERRDELLLDNTAAFRSIRRIPPPTGESSVRLGNAYEFFKNLDFFSTYWDDTSLPPKEVPSAEDSSQGTDEPHDKPGVPSHNATHQRIGTGSQLPPEYRQNLMTSFVKLVAYDFGCNVSIARSEPRLHLTPPSTTSSPPSHFNSSAHFIYRTPTERSAARGGIVEGPVATISCRTSTIFATEADSLLDLSREVVAVIITAQHRAREGKTEKRFGQDQWWTTVPRWGGGPGGPIGREADKADETASASTLPAPITQVEEKISPVTSETRRIFGINPTPTKRSKRGKENLQIYDNYRKLLPPAPTWDRRTRYMPIGKPVPGKGYDDIFLISALNHHVSIVRVRVPDVLLGVLEGGSGQWRKVVMWRSKWFDLFLSDDRVEAMQIVWGMMAWLMRRVDGPLPVKGQGEKMDTT
ncbi:hypothetical protein HYALB_00001262 [Hymenoscyphus albidus]|uniref:Uncharacterized protein n=1 Tax=Hymenoscyphus albidus TaxID=595503 RepID=A0A9N9LFL0_9HELO|nr:hypothetical protein HYALB_00001262 [Hymenoscyphus albidus]